MGDSSFRKIARFFMLANVKEVFANERYIFKKQENFDFRECEHNEEDFTATLPRIRCCRERKARLLIIDQILRVLRDSKRKNHPKNKALGNALSNAVNTSVLDLI